MRFSRISRATVVLLVLFVFAGCAGLDSAREAGERAGDGREEPSGSGSGEEQAQRSGEGQDAPAARPLENRYYRDSDGNEIPDFIEVENGEDPEVDDCAMEGGCGGVADDGVGESRITDEQNTLLILDSSGSMAEQDSSGVTKMDAARDVLERYVVGTPDSFNLGLMVYGHEGSSDEADRAESCAGIETFAPLGDLEVDNVRDTLGQFQPTGWTPVAGSLEAATGEFAGKEEAANRVILVTDGIETCDGDPVAAARELKESGIAVTVDVVGFDVADLSEQEDLRRVAEVTGGEYADAQNAAELNDYFDDVVARIFDIVGAQTCLRFQSSGATTCVNFTYTAATTDLNYELAEEPADSPRREAIEELKDRIEAHAEAYKSQIEESTGPRIEELQRELDETNARYTERYGNEVSFSNPCPEPSVMFARTKPVGSPGERVAAG